MGVFYEVGRLASELGFVIFSWASCGLIGRRVVNVRRSCELAVGVVGCAVVVVSWPSEL